MKKPIWVFLALQLITPAPESRAAWTRIGEMPGPGPVERLASDPHSADTLYAATADRLYKSLDAGRSWKRVLSWRGDGRKIRSIHLDPRRPGRVYVCGDGGLRFSENGGHRWEPLYKLRTDVFCAVSDPVDGDRVWLGTAQGLSWLERASGGLRRCLSFPERAVYSIHLDGSSVLAVTRDGVYRSADQGQSWEKVLGTGAADAELTDEITGSALGQMDIEEFFLPAPLPPRLIRSPIGAPILAATSDGLAGADSIEGVWRLMPFAAAPSRSIRALAADGSGTYIASDRGVHRLRDEKTGWSDVSDGLEGSEVRDLISDGRGATLWAATTNGVYRFIPSGTPAPAVSAPVARSEDPLAVFASEPAITEVQRWAVDYAEVQPEKIERWRRAAAASAFLPSLSLGADLSEDQNVDLDRGGTADPDRFITGPAEKARDWSVNVNWDLAEIVWNSDQTSIDTRSRLMVQLRDEVLSDVTQLYFERRRLQLEMASSVGADGYWLAERRLKLAELTARIDALTGGRFSRELSAAAPPTQEART